MNPEGAVTSVNVFKKEEKIIFFIQGLWKGPLIDNDGSSHEMTVKI